MREIVDRQVPYKLQVSGKLMQFMSNLPALSPKECYTWSRRLEPKDLDAAETVILSLLQVLFVCVCVCVCVVFEDGWMCTCC
jgi:hypothetical protein